MPTLPKLVKLSQSSTDILNAIRNDNGGLYRSVVPVADGTAENLRQIGTVILGDSQLQNAFLNALVNRIGRVIISSKLYSNPWARFKKGYLEHGETVEEIFVELANPNNYDPEVAEDKQFKRVIPDVKAVFHTMNYQKFYKTTVEEDQLRLAFLSQQGVTDLISKIIDKLYTSANYDELIAMKYLIAKIANKGMISKVGIDGTPAEQVEIIKGLSNDLEFMSDQYNMARVTTYTLKEDQYLITTGRFDARMDVQVLASAFNMDKAEFMGHRTRIDSFGFNTKEIERLRLLFGADEVDELITPTFNKALKDIPAFLLSKDWFMVFDNNERMTDKYNGEGLYWNYWLHVWKTFSVSPYENGVLLLTGTNGPIGIDITPGMVTTAPGSTVQFTATVTGAGIYNKKAYFEIQNPTAGVEISQFGLLTVGDVELQEPITVHAYAVDENGEPIENIMAVATVGVNQN